MFSGSKDSSIIYWDLETKKKVIMSYGKGKDPKGHYDEILCMDPHPTKDLLLTAGLLSYHILIQKVKTA